MVTTNVIFRVFHLKYGSGTGTCFAIDHQEKQYIVTAKHIVESLSDGGSVELYYQGNWVTLKVRLVGHHATADVTVFAIDYLLADLPLVPSSAGIFYGQDTYFLGFPYRMQDDTNRQINREFPLPLIKKATVSAIVNDSTGKYMILDGMNNLGFSGGPLVFADPFFRPSKPDELPIYNVGAIISAYRSFNEPVYRQDGPLDVFVKTNTGLIVAYNIENAIELIQANPIGKVI